MSAESSRQPAAPKANRAAYNTRAMYTPWSLLRFGIAGALMGIANLIPGVSGGTMVLAMGVYQEFIDSVADITAFRFRPARLVFLAVLGTCAIGAIVGLAGVILYLLFHHAIAMYSLFIGLTLGGAPLLLRALRPIRADVVIAALCGFGLMVGVLFLRQGAGFPHNPGMDVVSGLVGATTMVLPGVSGSYMLLVMDQYERVVGAVKDRTVGIIVPVALGGIIGIIGLSNLLKVFLHRFPRSTLGVLLGILVGSVAGLWPFGMAPNEKSAERRSAAELRDFAERWELPGVAKAPDEELPVLIVERWDERGRSSFHLAGVASAIVFCVAGFCGTYAMSRVGGRRAKVAADATGCGVHRCSS